MASIRMAHPDDAGDLLSFHAVQVRESHTSFAANPPTAKQLRQRIADALVSFPWLVCEHKGRAVGFASASRFREREGYRWTAEVSVYASPLHQRCGIGRALYTSLIALLRLQGFHSAVAVIALPNAASLALHEAVGFRQIGLIRDAGYKLGEWHDVALWQLLLEQRRPEPQMLRSPAEVFTAAAVRSAAVAGESLLHF